MKIPKNHENIICKECDGKCCKNMSCQVFPCDFKEITVKTIVKKIKAGYCFDYWEGGIEGKQGTAYFLRPQHKGYENKLIDPTWGGECIFLTDTGCKLSEKDRPSGGKALIPGKKISDKCEFIDGWEKYDSAKAWLKYNDIIEEAISKIRGNTDEIY